MSDGASLPDFSPVSGPGPVQRLYRALSPVYRGRPGDSVSVPGSGLLLALLLLLVPLFPLLLLVWVLSVLVGVAVRRLVE